MFNGAGGSDAFNNTHLTNNYILVARDLAGSLNGGIDNFQNIGIHFSVGTEPADLRQHNRVAWRWRECCGRDDLRSVFERSRYAVEHHWRRVL
jgi:hypothetical protein